MASPNSKPNLKGAKRKGDEYEREIAAYLNNAIPALGERDAPSHGHGIRLATVRRAPLSGGGTWESGFDVVGCRVAMGGGDWEFGIEAKRVEKFSPYEAMAQAVRHLANMAKRGFDVARVIPVVITRKNRMEPGDALVVMRLGDFARLIGNRDAWPKIDRPAIELINAGRLGVGDGEAPPSGAA